MYRPGFQTPKRSDRLALLAGAAASVVVHAILFVTVALEAPAPATDGRQRPTAVPAEDALRLIVLVDAPAPAAESGPESRRADGSSGATSSKPAPDAAGATARADARAASTPPVLLAYAAPVRSPLLIAAPADEGSGRAESAAPESAVDEAAAAARVATYTPGGVRSAKLGWAGQDAAKARRDGRIRRALTVDVGDGHCPARPPSRGPLGL